MVTIKGGLFMSENIHHKRHRLKKKYEGAREDIYSVVGYLTREFQQGKIDEITWQTYLKHLNELDYHFQRASLGIKEEE